MIVRMYIDINVKRIGNDIFNVYISENGNSGSEYKNVSHKQIGEYVADLIACVEESYDM